MEAGMEAGAGRSVLGVEDVEAGGVEAGGTEAGGTEWGVNVLCWGLWLVLGWAVPAHSLPHHHLLNALAALMALQLVWMGWHRARARTSAPTPAHAHADARWLRGSITLFAIITLILGSFKIGYFIGFSECLSVTEGVFPVIHAIHTVFQVYFLWSHAKDIIQSFKTLERFGVIHSVFTNLLLWANGVLAESKHQLNEHKERLITLGFGNITVVLDHHTPQCNCSTATICSIFSQGIYYLYPFNIEYHVLASTMLYVLWKNIGRQVESQQHQRIQFEFHRVIAGTTLGLAVLTSTISIVVIYLIQIGRSRSQSEAALIMFYLHAIASLVLMAGAGMAGIRISRMEARSPDDSKNPARQLDADLLVGAASGSWLISWGSILAVICAETRPVYTWYSLSYSILVVLEKYIQNLFIIEAIHHKPGKSGGDGGALPMVTVSNGNPASLSSPCSGRPRGAGEWDAEAPSEAGEPPPRRPGLSQDRRGDGKGDGRGNGPVASLTPDLSGCSVNSQRANGKRGTLRNIAAFLFLCNISLWIPPAFGCRPEYDNGLEEIVFGFEPWIIVVNLAMPFSIFYRMHSAASLFEVYCKI
ncbi:proton channel OTOP1 [Ornithorhynchus anatinus]|uniref:proton channel OTOP1 n=1 Tax=Ornithorhynchus anatinus TaxID=9258 RepID=UPI0019D46C63|nr:proton channel OTOP1 [Ornithorhynchus anatinus]